MRRGGACDCGDRVTHTVVVSVARCALASSGRWPEYSQCAGSERPPSVERPRSTGGGKLPPGGAGERAPPPEAIGNQCRHLDRSPEIVRPRGLRGPWVRSRSGWRRNVTGMNQSCKVLRVQSKYGSCSCLSHCFLFFLGSYTFN